MREIAPLRSISTKVCSTLLAYFVSLSYRSTVLKSCFKIFIKIVYYPPMVHIPEKVAYCIQWTQTAWSQVVLFLHKKTGWSLGNEMKLLYSLLCALYIITTGRWDGVHKHCPEEGKWGFIRPWPAERMQWQADNKFSNLKMKYDGNVWLYDCKLRITKQNVHYNISDNYRKASQTARQDYISTRNKYKQSQKTF